MTASQIQLSNEDQAWELIRKLSTNNVDENATVSFNDFPVVRIKYSGNNFKGNVNTRLCDVIYELQNEVNKIYCMAVYNDPSRRLTKEEHDSLEIFVTVAEGSSDLIANLSTIFNKIVTEGFRNMESKHIMIVMSVATISIGGYFIADKYFEHKTAINKDAVLQTMSQQETERFRILERIVKQNPTAEGAVSAGKAVGDKALKAIKPDETVETGGEKITYPEVKEKFKRTRTTPEEVEFSGQFYVYEVKVNEVGEFYAQLENADTGEGCVAKIGGLEPRIKDSVLTALGSRQPLNLSITGRQSKSVKKDCVIVGFGPQA